MRDGLIVERMPVDEVRRSFHLCECAKLKRQAVKATTKKPTVQGSLL